MTKRGSSFGYENSHDMRVVTLRGKVSFWDLRGRVLLSFSFEGCSEDIMYLFFSFFLRYIVLVHEVL